MARRDVDQSLPEWGPNLKGTSSWTDEPLVVRAREQFWEAVIRHVPEAVGDLREVFAICSDVEEAARLRGKKGGFFREVDKDWDGLREGDATWGGNAFALCLAGAGCKDEQKKGAELLAQRYPDDPFVFAARGWVHRWNLPFGWVGELSTVVATSTCGRPSAL